MRLDFRFAAHDMSVRAVARARASRPRGYRSAWETPRAMDGKIVASYLSSISKAMVVARRAAPSYVAPAFQRPPLSRGKGEKSNRDINLTFEFKS